MYIRNTISILRACVSASVHVRAYISNLFFKIKRLLCIELLIILFFDAQNTRIFLFIYFKAKDFRWHSKSLINRFWNDFF